jgi:hypothetical protein
MKRGIATDIAPRPAGLAPRLAVYRPIPPDIKPVPRRRPVQPAPIKPPARTRPAPVPRPAQRRSADGLMRSPARPAMPATAAAARPDPALSQPSPPVSAAPTSLAAHPAGRWWLLAQYPLCAAVALAAAFNAAIGQLFVAAFALYVLIRRPDTRLIFGVALFVLLTIPLFEALGRSGIAENAAIYVYELLVIGTISALLDLRKTD